MREIQIEEPGPDDVLVRMAAVGVCGSDLHVVRGEWKRATPMILGHEIAGTVAREAELCFVKLHVGRGKVAAKQRHRASRERMKCSEIGRLAAGKLGRGTLEQSERACRHGIGHGSEQRFG